jgi:glycosyltransferase involved in cell wall biosynthesis
MKLTFVFPCLNEEESLGTCIDQVRASLSQDPSLEYEIVVADNGSTDRSREIAVEKGARLVPVAKRGYGAALRGGIEAALGERVMFADADSTYLYEDALPLYRKAVEADVDMAIASRMTGNIEEGAMPPLHRHLGTPVLTGLINLLFSGNLSDCNSGFRCLRKTAYESWDIRSDGMEFASELLIKALKKNATTVEIDSGLRCGPANRQAHLRTWRDGMRHLLFILSERPQLFEWIGLIVLGLSSMLQLTALITGPIEVAGLNIFDFHSQALLLLAALTGTQLYLFSCLLYLRGNEKSTRLTRKLVSLDEGVLFFLLLGLFAGVFGVVAFMIIAWASAHFAGLRLINTLLILVHFLSVPGLLAIALLGIHVFKKSDREG